MTAGIVAAAAVLGGVLAWAAVAVLDRWWIRRHAEPPVGYERHRVACRTCGDVFNPQTPRGKRPVVKHSEHGHAIGYVDALTHVCGTDCPPSSDIPRAAAPATAPAPARPVDVVDPDSWVVVKGDLVLGAPHFSRDGADRRRGQLDPSGLRLDIRRVRGVVDQGRQAR